MAQHIGEIALLVRDYDEAIAWFTQKLGFALLTDTHFRTGKRWVTVAPSGGGTALLLARAIGEQAAAIGRQASGRVCPLFAYR